MPRRRCSLAFDLRSALLVFFSLPSRRRVAVALTFAFTHSIEDIRRSTNRSIRDQCQCGSSDCGFFFFSSLKASFIRGDITKINAAKGINEKKNYFGKSIFFFFLDKSNL